VRKWAAVLAGICALAACTEACSHSATAIRRDPNAVVQTERRLAAARALVAAGCLDCLVDAFHAYDALRSGSAAADEADGADEARSGAVRAAALAGIRERELGIEDSGALASARALAAASTEAASLLFDVASTLLGRDSNSQVTTDAELAVRATVASNRLAWTDALRTRANENELTAYLWVAFNCTYNPPTDAVAATLLDAVPAWRDTPLIRYRMATCTALRIPALAQLLETDPRFVEITYYLGLDGIIQGDLDAADLQFERAYRWRPRWASLANTRGNVSITAEDFDQAAAFFDRALDVVPEHAQALLGKVRALTFGGHYADALAATDALLALEHWFIGDARYFRAMNELQLGRYDEAWDDVERAALLITNAEVPKLAGIIAVQRQQPQVARARFVEARRRNGRDCEVPFFLGSVLIEQREWALSTDAFVAAASCLDRSERDLDAELAELRAAAPSARQARQIVRREQQRAAGERMRATSWFNTAAAYYNLALNVEPRRSAERTVEAGQAAAWAAQARQAAAWVAQARQYAERVINDAQFGQRARDLLARLPP
jgi:hypothetical protein